VVFFIEPNKEGRKRNKVDERGDVLVTRVVRGRG